MASRKWKVVDVLHGFVADDDGGNCSCGNVPRLWLVQDLCLFQIDGEIEMDIGAVESIQHLLQVVF